MTVAYMIYGFSWQCLTAEAARKLRRSSKSISRPNMNNPAASTGNGTMAASSAQAGAREERTASSEWIESIGTDASSPYLKDIGRAVSVRCKYHAVNMWKVGQLAVISLFGILLTAGHHLVRLVAAKALGARLIDWFQRLLALQIPRGQNGR
ncbi:hypothetical protein BAUCODRAFT_38282 [Baudoinia panamericana UAMH 10762]|uniref:Uncharacterized protein n=1 Tax=Baudoinia panamericana (strain UAMH 10762) TaxID=717646 RepID=M2MLH8_BAUPA|nr:uncharacterized protein BAUCODRAFT_38282 [Baudoinia panamericana UAMH 10762]EMC92253.1 hypothetical protein BAUCODRAFT_38282 [Baudoinia panamericana UAMH 10762]